MSSVALKLSLAMRLCCAGIGFLGCLSPLAGTANASPPRQARPTLPYDEPVEGMLNEDGTGTFWTLPGSAGAMILIDMRAAEPDAMDPFMTLLGPDGAQLAQDDDSGAGLDARMGPVILPEDGDYTIVVSSYRGTGAYELAATNLDGVPTIARSKPLVGRVDRSTPVDYFILDTSVEPAESLLRLALSTEESDPLPLLTLIEPDGAAISTEYTGGNVLDPIAPLDNARYVIAIDWRPGTAGGPYALTLGPSEVALLAPGVTQRREITLDEGIERHYFRAKAGDVIRLRVTRTGGNIAPALRVLTADFSHALFTSEGSATLGTSVVLGITADGLYVVEVGEGTAQSSSGTYTLSAEWLTG